MGKKKRKAGKKKMHASRETNLRKGKASLPISGPLPLEKKSLKGYPGAGAQKFR